jgi:cytochrome c-type biogenesis protein CcmH
VRSKLKINHPNRLILLLLIVSTASIGVYYGSRDSATTAAYNMDDFLATKPAVAATRTPAAERAAEPAAPELGSVANMLEGLKQRLRTDADDVEGWILLAKSYYYLNRQAESKEAFDKAVAAGYEGVWKPLPRIDSVLGQTNSLGDSTSEISLDHYSAGNTAATTNSLDPYLSSGINLQVSLAADLENAFPPETAVYVFARNVDGAGPPLAVVQKKVRDLPLSITLNDSHSMMPDLTISSVERVIVGARVSISGGAIRQDGDLEQLSDPVSTTRDDQIIALSIKSNKS